MKEDNRRQITDYSLKIIQNPTSDRNLKIQYSLPKVLNIKLIIYNILGRIEEVLVDGIIDAGVHEIDQNKELSAGIYFVQLQTPDQTTTNKVVILK